MLVSCNIISFVYSSINCHDEEIFEIDLTNFNDFIYVGCYARNIFNYLRQREVSCS